MDAAVLSAWVVAVALALLLAAVALLLRLVLRRPDDGPLRETARDLERSLRDELERQAQGTRGDMAHFQQTLLTQGGETARAQHERIEAFRAQLGQMQQQLDASLRRFAEQQAEQLRLQAHEHERRHGELRQSVEARLVALQEGNERRLEQMRATVDEKLQATLEQRLGESFRQVAERLEQVHRGLGEMQLLARDVGSLNRVLTNVKTRGIFGEVQLGGLLEQVFTPGQYATDVVTVPGSAERVEFAIRLPGQRADGAPLWLPIDAKFPREDYERLLDAHERADAAGVEAAGRAIEVRLRTEARTIREKYVAPPHTTDFGVLFVPTEGLYAEALRRPGLVEALQRDHKVMLAGPTTLLAMLTSLQMGFRTLALEQRSTEVWEVLGAVKTEFGKFGEALARTRRKLEEATNTIDAAQTRTNVMNRRLKSVESLPEARASVMWASDADTGPAQDALRPQGGTGRVRTTDEGAETPPQGAPDD